MVTDKAATIADNYGRACKWGFTIWPLEGTSMCAGAPSILGHLCITSDTNNTFL